MAEPTSDLFCSEDSNTCFYYLGCGNATDECFPSSHYQSHQTPNEDSIFKINGSDGFSPDAEDIFRVMIEKEGDHLPRDDYLVRLRSGDLDLCIRREALDWIWKAHSYYSFGPMSICLSINYLDRFLSVYELPREKTWTVQLLAVACLSLGAKVEETQLPLTVELQVGEPKYVFEGKTIQRMELLVLSTLKWKVMEFSPCSFVDYFLSKMSGYRPISGSLISKSMKLILSTIKGIDFLEFRPSEIAAAVALSVLGELQATNIDKAMSCFLNMEKSKVLKCFHLIGGSTKGANGLAASSVPESPVGVLDAPCLSYKSDDLTVGSYPNSSYSSPDTKRRRIHTDSDVNFKE